MTGDFLVGSRFVYGMRTPDWIGIPYTDIGFSIPYIKFPEFKIPKKFVDFRELLNSDNFNKYNCIFLPFDAVIKALKL